MKIKKMPYILGIIPARGGSKRLPNKNIKLLNGRPLIEYIIKTGLRSDNIDKLIVSTDSKEIRRIALKSGASVPFLRPKELARDASPSEGAVRHAILFMEKYLKRKIDIIVLLQATSPFTTVGIIDKCIKLLLKKNWDAVITVKTASEKAEWIGFLNDKGGFEKIIKGRECFKLARIKEYIPSGNVYVFKRKVVFEGDKIIGKNTGAFVVSNEAAVDIDYPLDFLFAEFLLKNKLSC